LEIYFYFRLYYDVDHTGSVQSALCDLACGNPNLDLCFIQKLPGTPTRNATTVFAMNWRFFPTLDPQVSAFVSRDLDSRFSEREFSAVSEWLDEDGSAFHIMRDHPEHAVHMLGSGWGVKLENRYTTS
jgi:hypothetical protein